jgi:putative tricarboxylic transport membrane protein
MAMETVVVFIAGIIGGIFSGIMPGVGGLVMMTMAYPILISLDPANILIFYITLISIDQFFGGVTAITLAMPGSSMSVPTMIEGHEMFRNGQGDKAIMYSAIGSWFASVFSVLLIVCLLPFLFLAYGIWNTLIQSLFFSIATVAVCMVSKNNMIVNILLFCFGITLAKVGWHEDQGKMMYTMGLEVLETGLPMLSVLTSLFVVPMLATSYLKNKKSIQFKTMTFSGYLESFKQIWKYKFTLLRSSLLGSIGGFVPGLAYAFSSMLSYSVERWIRVRKKIYKKGDVNCLIASESANNAGAFTQMVPLLFLGIPITASEALIYNILQSRGMPVDITWFSDLFSQVVFYFLVSASIGLVLAGKYVNLLSVLNNIKVSYVYLGIVTFLLLMNYTVGAQQYNAFNQTMITVFLMPVGLLFIGRDVTPLVFGFVLSEPLVDSFYRIYQLYLG